MTDRLFCYGTLQAREIIGAVTGLTLAGENALLHGFSCYRVKNAVYPGITNNPADSVTGTLYEGVDDVALEKLDVFEGEMYERLQLTVVRDQGQSSTAWCYVVKADFQHFLTSERWIYEKYEEQFLTRFRIFSDV